MEKKYKVSIYLKPEEKKMLDELVIKSIQTNERKSLSFLLGTALKDFYKKQISKQ